MLYLLSLVGGMQNASNVTGGRQDFAIAGNSATEMQFVRSILSERFIVSTLNLDCKQ
jgi:hypothetical protein